jgi:hypothetical protein
LDPTLGGFPIFGTACHVEHLPRPTAHQYESFFGVDGTISLYGGSRGRTFEIFGVFVDSDLPSVLAQEALLLTYADGIARTFTDTHGRSWSNVIFQGEYQPNPDGPKITDLGWCLPFRCTLHALQ